MKRIIIIQRIFPVYRKPIFDAIHRKIDFLLLHSSNTSGIKQTEAQYSSYIKQWTYSKKYNYLFLRVFYKIWNERPKVIIHEMAAGILSIPLVIMLKRVLGYKLILWGHMYDHKKGFKPENKLSDRYRHYLHRAADALITYSYGEQDVLVKYRINPSKIFTALNTLDTNLYLPVRNDLIKRGKTSIKEELGFKKEYNIIYIGRIYQDKLPHYLIDILKILMNKGNNSTAVHFVGSGPAEKGLRKQTIEMHLADHVFFHGPIYDEKQTGKFLFASDIMVMPGCVGLAVNHAFCFDCPVITFKAVNNVPAHGPEIEYIVDRKTGFLVENENIAEMANTINNYFNDKQLQLEVKQQVRYMIENICTIENMVDGFERAINYSLNTKK